MFVTLGESLSPQAAANDNSVIDFLEHLLSGHRCGNIVLVPTRRDIHAFGQFDLSRSAKATLVYISNKLQDYITAMRLAARTIEAHHPDFLANYVMGDDRIVKVSMNMLHWNRLHTRTFFLAENTTDVRFIQILCDVYLSGFSYPASLINYRMAMGGGNTLAAALVAEEPSPLKGLVLVDKDAADDAPPFPAGSTGLLALNTASNLNLCNGTLGWSDCNPMFVFLSTHGRMLENYVGPNLLNVYFEANGRREERRAIVNAFPTFPRLTATEMHIWQMLNLKVGTGDGDTREILRIFRTNFGAVDASILPRLRFLNAAIVPGDAIEWVIEHALASRYSATLKHAIKRDMAYEDYRRAIGKLADHLKDVAAGDKAAARL